MRTCLLCQNELSDRFLIQWLWQMSPLPDQTLICTSCRQSFHKLMRPQCMQCARELVGEGSLCQDCLRWQQLGWTFRHHALFHYDPFFKAWLASFKRIGDVRLAAVFKDEIQAFHQQYPEHVFVPVPSTIFRFQERGFHQTELILAQSDVPYVSLFMPTKNLHKQSDYSRKERMNRQLQLEVKSDIVLKPSQQFILFDDVYTTGSTIRQCENKIKTLYEVDVIGFSLAR